MSEAKLSPAGVTLAEHKRNIWYATAEHGITKDDILNPSYWGHVANRLRPKDRIEIQNEDDSFFAELLVISSDKTWAKVVLLKYVDLNQSATEITKDQADQVTSAYAVIWRGPKKYSVVRKSDRAVMQEGMHSKEDAESWLAVHLKTQGIAA